MVVGRHHHPFMRREQLTLDDLADCEWVIGTPGANRGNTFREYVRGPQRPQSRIATCSLPIIRPLLTQSDRLTLLTNFELMHEEDVLAALPFGPIEPVPSIGLTMRQNWLPTQLQAQVIGLIRQRIVKSLGPPEGVAANHRSHGRAAQGAPHRGLLAGRDFGQGGVQYLEAEAFSGSRFRSVARHVIDNVGFAPELRHREHHRHI